MKKVANDNFDKILNERSKEAKIEKAKKEALRQFNVENYYNDYHELVLKEKKRLRKRQYSSFKRVLLFTILIFLIMIIFFEIYYFFYFNKLF